MSMYHKPNWKQLVKDLKKMASAAGVAIVSTASNDPEQYCQDDFDAKREERDAENIEYWQEHDPRML